MSVPVPRPARNIAVCCICGQVRNVTDPRIAYRSLDLRWWCTDEKDCTDRALKRAEIAATQKELDAMQNALNDVWSALEAQGWRLPQ